MFTIESFDFIHFQLFCCWKWNEVVCSFFVVAVVLIARIFHVIRRIEMDWQQQLQLRIHEKWIIFWAEVAIGLFLCVGFDWICIKFLCNILLFFVFVWSAQFEMASIAAMHFFALKLVNLFELKQGQNMFIRLCSNDTTRHIVLIPLSSCCITKKNDGYFSLFTFIFVITATIFVIFSH